MLWAPNEMYANDYSVDNIYGGYTPYWPGAESVDIVGLSFYHYGTQARLNNMPNAGEAANVISVFDSLYASGQNRSMVLAETGAAYVSASPGETTILAYSYSHS